MPYAEFAHVKARAGYLSGAWDEQSKPSDTDVTGFLSDIAGEIDAAIIGLGIAAPTEGSAAAKALLGMNADGALMLALDATFPAGEGPSAATELQSRLASRYDKAWERLLSGKHPATTAPEATDEGGNDQGASSFWTENPEYGLLGVSSEADPAYPNPAIDPVVVRGQVW